MKGCCDAERGGVRNDESVVGGESRCLYIGTHAVAFTSLMCDFYGVGRVVVVRHSLILVSPEDGIETSGICGFVIGVD